MSCSASTAGNCRTPTITTHYLRLPTNNLTCIRSMLHGFDFSLLIIHLCTLGEAIVSQSSSRTCKEGSISMLCGAHNTMSTAASTANGLISGGCSEGAFGQMWSIPW